MYSNKNSLKSQLTANVGVLDTSISITSGEGVLRDTDTVACLEHYEDSVCTKREIVKITAKSTDTFTITRGFAVCIMNDSTKQQGQASQQFVVGDFLSVYLSKELRESLTTGITTNITNYETMVARVNAPRTCINNCCQDWKNAINTAYETRCCGNAGFGNGCDGDCVISEDTFLCADREYNFNNLTICEGVKVRFEGCGVPTINVRDKFCNMGTIDLRAGFVPACCQNDCRLSKGCTICNQCESWNIGCGGTAGCNPTCTASTYKGADGCNATTGCGGAGGKGGDATGYRAGTGGAGSPADGCNGGRGGNGAGGCSASSDTISGGGGGGGGGRCFGNGGDGGNGADSNIGFPTGGKGGNGGMWGKGGRGGLGGCQCNAYLRNGAGGGDGYYGGDGMYGRTGDSSQTAYGGAGGKGVICGGAGGDHVGSGGESTARYIIGGRGGDAITNVYGFHLNARNIRNCCVNGRGGDGGRGGNSGYCQTGGTGGNGANGGQMIISYDCIHEEGCFDIRGGNGGAGGTGRTQGTSGTAGTDGRIVFNSVNYPYISDFNLENDSDNEAILISWKDPSIKQSLPTQWAKTIVRVSTTNYPATITDGTLVVEETVKNQYRDTPYSMSATDGTTYYFSAFALDQNDTMIDVQTNEITTEFGYVVNADTLLYCPLNNDILDHSGNHTMTLNTTAYGTVEKDSTGFYHFTGGYISSEDYTGPTQGTISAWVKRETKTTGDTSLQRGLTNTYKYGSPFYNMAFEFNKSRYTAVGNGNTTYFRNIGASLLEERELRTMTYSPSEGGKMYRNAVLVDSFSSNQNLWQYNGPTLIGGSNWYNSSRPTPGSQYFKGYLSDVFMEKKVQSQADIQTYFNKVKEKYWRKDFQEVEYIKSSGTQYIDTQIVPKTTTKVVSKVMVESFTATQQDTGIWGVWYNYSSNGRFNLWYRNGSGYGFGYGSNNGQNYCVNVSLGEIAEIENYVSNGTVYNIVNGTTKTYTGASFTQYTGTAYLFKRNVGSSSETAQANIRIYNFKLYDNGTLVRDFVPVYRKSDGVIGMFDKVNCKFYTNAGSGTFTKGADVN